MDCVLIGTKWPGCMGMPTHTEHGTNDLGLTMTGKKPAFRCELNEGGRDGGKCHRLPAEP